MPPTILLIDDDAGFLAQMRRPLDEAGYSVLEATDGSTALQTIDRLHSHISLIVIDLALPTLSGFEVLGALTRRKAPIKTIVMTGVLSDLYLDIARNMGADLALRKPVKSQEFSAGEWLKTVNSVLGTNAVGSAC